MSSEIGMPEEINGADSISNTPEQPALTAEQQQRTDDNTRLLNRFNELISKKVGRNILTKEQEAELRELSVKYERRTGIHTDEKARQIGLWRNASFMNREGARKIYDAFKQREADSFDSFARTGRDKEKPQPPGDKHQHYIHNPAAGKLRSSRR